MKDWIKQSRKLAGLTQSELGDMLGKTKANISGWENGLHSPSYEQVLKIAEITGWAQTPPGLEKISAPWPFPSLEPATYRSLTPTQKASIEEWVATQVHAFASSAMPPGREHKKTAA